MRISRNRAVFGLLLAFMLPAMAQQADDSTDNSGMPATHSTPAEQAQTQQLNNAAADSAATANQANSQAEMQSDQQQQQYQQQQQQYQAAQQNYADQSARYEAQRSRYAAERARYHRGAWPARYEDELIVSRSGLVDSRLLVDGHDMGRVTDIATGPGGHVDAVRVALDHDRGDVWIDAADLRFDPDNHVVVTDLSRHDVHEMARESF
jgi:hypothetical protein